jgi:hypothetical protein
MVEEGLACADPGSEVEVGGIQDDALEASVREDELGRHNAPLESRRYRSYHHDAPPIASVVSLLVVPGAGQATP